jgi:signal transduction histidine kinase
MQSQIKGSEYSSMELLVADSVTAMLAYWDRDLICRFANAAYLAWFGKTRDELVGKITLKELLGPIYPLNATYIRGALNGHVQSFERTVPVPDSNLVRTALVNFFPDVVDGIVQGFVVHGADVSSMKVLEDKLEHSNEIIRNQNKSLLNFANIVSHNLKSYANNLEAMLALYEEERDVTEQQQLFRYLKDISVGFKASVKNLSEIIEVQNLGNAPMQEVNLYEYVLKASEVLRTEIRESDARLEINLSPFVYIEANPAYMESILLNFLSNAIKYRHPSRTPVIELSTKVIGNETVLSIKDNGIGIDLEKHRQNLYGMYKTFHDNEDATGIGLFISKYQIESMGGYIGVESKPGAGTWFRIYFKTKAVV